MAFNGSGVFNRVHDWTTDLTNTVPVTASRMDAEDDGFATGLSLTICRDGQSTTTARIPFASGTSTAAGTTASVAYAQTNDLNTGMYFPATDQWGLVAGGTATLTSTSSALTATGTLTVTGASDFGGAVLPTNSDGGALGSATKMWSDLFLASGAVINFNNGNATMTHAAGSLTTAVTTFAITGALTVSTTAAITGAATLSNTLAVTGAATLSSTLALAGNLDINTNKFNVTAASGNTAIAGTLAVTGASTLTGALTANAAAGVTARNTCKAYVHFTTDASSVVTIVDSFNIDSVATATVESQNGFQLTIGTDIGSGAYAVSANARSGTITQTHVVNVSGRVAGTVDIVVMRVASTAITASLIVDVFIFENP